MEETWEKVTHTCIYVREKESLKIYIDIQRDIRPTEIGLFGGMKETNGDGRGVNEYEQSKMMHINTNIIETSS